DDERLTGERLAGQPQTAAPIRSEEVCLEGERHPDPRPCPAVEVHQPGWLPDPVAFRRDPHVAAAERVDVPEQQAGERPRAHTLRGPAVEVIDRRVRQRGPVANGQDVGRGQRAGGREAAGDAMERHLPPGPAVEVPGAEALETTGAAEDPDVAPA